MNPSGWHRRTVHTRVHTESTLQTASCRAVVAVALARLSNGLAASTIFRQVSPA